MRPPQEPRDEPWSDGNAALDPARFVLTPTSPVASSYHPVAAAPDGTAPATIQPHPPDPPYQQQSPVRSEPRPPRTGRGPTEALVAVATFVASLILYGIAFRPALGIGITLLLLVHELGHYVVVRAKGLPAGLPIFIPFIGAYVAIRGIPTNVRDEAEIALAGPLIGGTAALACFAAYEISGIPVLLPLAYLGFALNLINLAPVSPLDGGRAARAFPPWLWLVAFLAAAGASTYLSNPLGLVVAVALGIQVIQSAGRVRTKSPYFRVPPGARIALLAAYIGLALALAVGMGAAHDAILTRPPA